MLCPKTLNGSGKNWGQEGRGEGGADVLSDPLHLADGISRTPSFRITSFLEQLFSPKAQKTIAQAAAQKSPSDPRPGLCPLHGPLFMGFLRALADRKIKLQV